MGDAVQWRNEADRVEAAIVESANESELLPEGGGVLRGFALVTEWVLPDGEQMYAVLQPKEGSTAHAEGMCAYAIKHDMFRGECDEDD